MLPSDGIPWILATTTECGRRMWVGFEPQRSQVRGSILVAGAIDCHAAARSVQESRVQRRMGSFHFLRSALLRLTSCLNPSMITLRLFCHRSTAKLPILLHPQCLAKGRSSEQTWTIAVKRRQQWLQHDPNRQHPLQLLN